MMWVLFLAVPVEVPTFEMMPERVQLYVQMDQLRFNRWVDDMLQMRVRISLHVSPFLQIAHQQKLQKMPVGYY